MDMVNHFEASESSLFIKGMVDPNIIKKGDLKEIGKSLQDVSDFLMIKAKTLEFLTYESEESGMEMRLNHYVNALKDMGNKLEKSITKKLMITTGP